MMNDELEKNRHYGFILSNRLESLDIDKIEHMKGLEICLTS